ELGSQTYDVYSTYQQQPSSMIMINQSPGSNAVEVGKEVNAAMRELSQSFPEGMHYHTIVDSTRTILLGIHDIVVTLALALLLVVLVIYLFLQNIRATIVPIIAIPVSLVGAFMVFPLFGFSINVFSLLGLVLAIGLVVDDAIVVVEAVQVNIEKGMNGKDATIAAMKTVASPIIATTTVLMAVFLPVGLMPGAAGKLYGQFAITIAISVALSGVNALSLSPALCSILLRPQSGKKTKGFFGWFNRRFGRSVDSYLKTSKIMVRHSARTLIFIAISVIAVLLLLKTVPTGFLPNEDQGYLMADVQLPEAASLNRTKEAIDRINSILRRNDNVQSVTSVAGFSILSGNQSPNSGLIFIRLKDWSQRKMTAGQITTRLNEQLYYEINSAQVYTFGPPSIPGLGPGSGFTIMIQDKGGNTPGYLADYTDRFIAAARQRPEIATISTTFQADEPQKTISIDNEKVLKAGISLDELHSQISSYLGGMYVNNFNRFGRMYQTYIQAEDEYRLNESKLDMFYLTNDRGESVPLSAFITVRDTTGPQFTNRFNLYRAAGVTGLPASEYSTAQAMKALEEVADEVLPSDMGYAWSNMSYQEAQKSGAGTVFLYAVVFVFLILAALYESWTLPLSILLGIPFAVFGALAFTYLGYLFNPVYINDIFLQVSLIMLIGLAAKNAILIVEYARDKFDEGMDLQQAALEGAKLRVRPVVMTAVAFLMGVLPLILATGSNAVARNIMGLALFGGMLVATVIGLYAYPALFVLVGRMSRYEQKRKTKNEKS
ncbi:efflux RND transporter permease subunit, partial [Alistipes ihumii]